MLYIQRYRSPLGEILMAADDAGLVGLWFAGQKHFAPGLTQAREQETPVLAAAGRWLDLYFAGRRPHFTPPLHLTGTEFRMAVWSLLQEIPYGEVTTYGELARQLAQRLEVPHMSAQAVGGAVGHNPISLIVPCHRVIGADGSLTGYGQEAPPAGLGGAGRVPICLTIPADPSAAPGKLPVASGGKSCYNVVK